MSSLTFNKCGPSNIIRGDINLRCNSLIDVSNIFFCNSTNYIDTISKLDVSVNQLEEVIDDLIIEFVDLSDNKYDKSGGLISGDVEISGNVNVTGNFSVSGTKTYRIQHPIRPNYLLYNNAVEAPSCELIFRGKITMGQQIQPLSYNKDFK